jgi:hypothetical protein
MLNHKLQEKKVAFLTINNLSNQKVIFTNITTVCKIFNLAFWFYVHLFPFNFPIPSRTGDLAECLTSNNKWNNIKGRKEGRKTHAEFTPIHCPPHLPREHRAPEQQISKRRNNQAYNLHWFVSVISFVAFTAAGVRGLRLLENRARTLLGTRIEKAEGTNANLDWK